MEFKMEMDLDSLQGFLATTRIPYIMGLNKLAKLDDNRLPAGKI